MSYTDFERLEQPAILKFSWKSVSMQKGSSERWEGDL